MSLFNPPLPTKYNFLSLGAGVQSSTLALMAAHGEIGPMPDAAIFADTQAEPKSVYDWLDWLEKQLPFPVYRVTKGSLEKRVLDMRVTKDGRIFAKTDIPFFTLSEKGKPGMIPNRACTLDFKINPIRKKIKELAGIKRGQTEATVTQWIGISSDEAHRMKPSRDKWSVHRWPLVELEMKRHQCLAWMLKNGYPQPPRSSCVFCPYHSNREWRRLKMEEPEEFTKAVEFEKGLQKVKAASGNFSSTPFLTASRVPLETIDFSNDTDNGQQLLWGNECEGMCGV